MQITVLPNGHVDCLFTDTELRDVDLFARRRNDPKIQHGVRSQRVEERLESGPEKLTLEEALDMGAGRANRTEFDQHGLLRSEVDDRALGAEVVLIEIPADFQAIKSADMGLAREWRLQTREIFLECFGAGYVATDFISEVQEGRRRNFYLLQQAFELA